MNGVNIFGAVGLLYLLIAFAAGAPESPEKPGWNSFVWHVRNLTFWFWIAFFASLFAFAWKG